MLKYYEKARLAMDLSSLNPFIRSVALYETPRKSGERIGYDARVIYMISGDAAMSVDGLGSLHLTPGKLLYIPSGTKYSIKAQYMRAVVVTFDLSTDSKDISRVIAPDAPENFKAESAHPCNISPLDRALILEDAESERDNFINMSNIAISAEGAYRERISAELKLILIKLCESVCENALPSRMVDTLDSYIRENCHDEISNTEIGAIFGYHPFYVSRVLKDKKGMTLRQYIISHKLKIAKAMLENTKKSIAEIAEETGFTDASYFTKTFKSAFGISPKDYKANFKEEYI